MLERFLAATLFEAPVNERMTAKNIDADPRYQKTKGELSKWDEKWVQLKTDKTGRQEGLSSVPR
jgi:hypothetical protein